MTKAELLSAYKQYLTLGGNHNAQFYADRLEEACARLARIAKHLDLIAGCCDPDGQLTYAKEIRQEIDQYRKKAHCTEKDKKTMGNAFTAANKLIDFLAKKPYVKGSRSTIEETAVSVTMGGDRETALVVYEKSVYVAEQIPSLCQFLDDEYEKIRLFAARILKGVWQDFPAIPVYLSKTKPQKTYYYNKEVLLKKMAARCKECDRIRCTPPHCGISDILERCRPFTMEICGEFYSDPEPHIIIFFKNFDLNTPQFWHKIAKTLAHEYLHYLHYRYTQTSGEDPFANEKLSEALADFFGVYYSLDQGNMETAEARYAQWYNRQNSDWPYACALKFWKKPYKRKLADYDTAVMDDAEAKFRDVFKKCTDSVLAYRALCK